MSNASTSVIFSDLIEREDIPEEARGVIGEIVRRLDVAFGELLSGLRNESTVFPYDPTNADNAEFVEGAKPGDIAVYRDNVGDVKVSVFE